MDLRSIGIPGDCNTLELFAGAAGLALGVRLAVPRARVVCYVEIEAYASEVLASRMEDGGVDPAPLWTDVRTFDGEPWRGVVDLVAGGFPCTDISVAGEGAGIDGEHSGLWRDYIRIVRQVRPRLVFVENVAALTSRGLDRVLGDLAASGYDAEWGVFSAAEVGAPHLRERIFILAVERSVVNAARDRQSRGRVGRKERLPLPDARLAGPRLDVGNPDRQGRQGERGDAGAECATTERAGGVAVADAIDGERLPGGRDTSRRGVARFGFGGVDVPDAEGDELRQLAERDQRTGRGEGAAERRDAEPRDDGEPWTSPFPPGPADSDGWRRLLADDPSSQPSVCRNDDGLEARVDRLRLCGNGVVPQTAALAFAVLYHRFDFEVTG